MFVLTKSETRLIQHIAEERRSAVDGENLRTPDDLRRVVSGPGIGGATAQVVRVDPFVDCSSQRPYGAD